MFYEMGLQLYEQHRYKEAIANFKKALEDPKEERVGACYYLAKCCSNEEKEQFESYLLKAMRYGEPSPEVCSELGMYYMEQSKYEQAIPLFFCASIKKRDQKSKLYIKDYWDYIPYLELSVCYDRLGEMDEAYRYHKLAASIYPRASAIIYNEEYYKSFAWKSFKELAEKKKKEVIERRRNAENKPKPGVSMITVTNKKKYMDNIVENYRRAQYEKKELILILNSNEMDCSEIKQYFTEDTDVQVVQLDETVTLGECLNYGVAKAKYEYVAKIDDDDYYGANYLLDAVISSEEFGADVIVKSRGFVYFERNEKLYQFMGLGEYKKVFGGFGGTIVAKKSLFQTCKFPDVNVGEDQGFFERCSQNGFKVYSGNKFNYLYKRHKSQADHTWVTADRSLTDYSIEVACDMNIEEFISV